MSPVYMFRIERNSDREVLLPDMMHTHNAHNLHLHHTLHCLLKMKEHNKAVC